MVESVVLQTNDRFCFPILVKFDVLGNGGVQSIDHYRTDTAFQRFEMFENAVLQLVDHF